MQPPSPQESWKAIVINGSIVCEVSTTQAGVVRFVKRVYGEKMVVTVNTQVGSASGQVVSESRQGE